MYLIFYYMEGLTAATDESRRKAHCTLVILSTVFQSNYDFVLIRIYCKNLQFAT